MNSNHDKIQELEKKIDFLQACHREQIRYLVRRIGDLQDELNKLSSVLPDLAAVEKLALDAYAAATDEAQDALLEVDRVVPLDMPPQFFFNQLPTIREAQRKS